MSLICLCLRLSGCLFALAKESFSEALFIRISIGGLCIPIKMLLNLRNLRSFIFQGTSQMNNFIQGKCSQGGYGSSTSSLGKMCLIVRIRVMRRVQVGRRSFFRRRGSKGFRVRWSLGRAGDRVKSDACALCILAPSRIVQLLLNTDLTMSITRQVENHKNIHQREHFLWIKAKLSEQKEQKM